MFPLLLYGAESWNVKSHDRRKIDYFELWCWRTMLRILWTARRTNVSIQEIRKTERLLQLVCSRILGYFRHITRRTGDNLEQLAIQDIMEGTRRKQSITDALGRPNQESQQSIYQATRNEYIKVAWTNTASYNHRDRVSELGSCSFRKEADEEDEGEEE